MTKTKSTLKDDQNSKPEQGITKISVSGYKSLADECSIEIAPLTILSGANSSGKSSIMQPLLLMKQTLESTYDAGSLKINGANVRLTSTDQIFTKSINKLSSVVNSFTVSLELNEKTVIKNTFKKESDKVTGIKIFSSVYKYLGFTIDLNLDMNDEKVLESCYDSLVKYFSVLVLEDKEDINDFAHRFRLSLKYKYSLNNLIKNEDNKTIERIHEFSKNIEDTYKIWIKNYRCFLYLDANFLDNDIPSALPSEIGSSEELAFTGLFKLFGSEGVYNEIMWRVCQLIHVAGLRGNPERTYPVSYIGQFFTGTFENYVASIIHSWKVTKDKRLKQLGEALQILGLTWKVDTKQIDDTQVEVRVGRLKTKSNSKSTDMVSIADVGFGLSQTLPVIVALLVAEPEQLVYLEQPEIHLHPRAQANLAQLLVDAANRGVRVVVETHCELLIRRVQSLIAEDKIAAEKVKLHWFSQDDNGFTKVTTAELDETGAFGDWPEDFSEISLQEESRYLDAAESKLMAV
ncbi:DUF3696 domain-containing protein [Pseudanabaena galeata UHCC 0370]|uniref:DUF3696 domain-containing protein n=1 Tax=Pseudanabaena galeata UHCC 0370 TaxID=3110310 RepID=A0ABU5TGV4_9CYAN|nr:DUF3696 domain-containing protein [Pseudanabaena galeata]MEA5477496.1 DUF3696 domain-containing protein [Pseudanabaena galeata UHCC 0370]